MPRPPRTGCGFGSEEPAPESIGAGHDDVRERRGERRLESAPLRRPGPGILEKGRRHRGYLVFELVAEQHDVLPREIEKPEKAQPFRREQIAIGRKAELPQEPLGVEDVPLGPLGPLVLVEPQEQHEVEAAEGSRAPVDDLDPGLAAPDSERVLLDRASELLPEVREIPRSVGDTARGVFQSVEDGIEGGLRPLEAVPAGVLFGKRLAEGTKEAAETVDFRRERTGLAERAEGFARRDDGGERGDGTGRRIRALDPRKARLERLAAQPREKRAESIDASRLAEAQRQLVERGDFHLGDAIEGEERTSEKRER